ncbi:hypothetical protein Asp14428_77720 [Actinoplanes sp. NBRC 14428]|nr:hypothetical protein Asp14428_77720 [Actinoplanes sp. NBRC 14428]
MRRAKILTAIIVMTAVSACGPAESGPAAAPPASPPAARASSASPATREAVAACKLAAAAPRKGEAVELDEQAVKSMIKNAGASGLDGVARAGAQVQARYSAWLGAAIGDGAANAMDDVLDAVGKLEKACAEAGVAAR